MSASLPAFPVPAGIIDSDNNGRSFTKYGIECAAGMTLRDYFAARAPEAIPDWFEVDKPTYPAGDWKIIDTRTREVLFHATSRTAAEKHMMQLHPYVCAENENETAQKAWAISNTTARFYQWRWAYADAMIVPRASSAPLDPNNMLITEEQVFAEFPKIPRWSREIVVTEKIDGTNGCIQICADGSMLVGSRSRWITPAEDNHGFAAWANRPEIKADLLTLGVGRHFGEWWGSGIQRGYGLRNGDKRFSLFNTGRWHDDRPLGASRIDKAICPACCSVVPVLYDGPMSEAAILHALEALRGVGSITSPGFTNPEGVIIFHKQGNLYFKKTLHKDEEPKGGYVYGLEQHTITRTPV